MTRRAGSRPPNRNSTREDERGSLPLVMLVMMVGLAMGALLVPILIRQDQSSTFLNTRQTSLAAAQAGIDVVAGRIRAATTATGAGNPAKLPCYPAANPATGAASGAASGAATGTVGSPAQTTYRTTVTYYTTDPVQDSVNARTMLCIPGAGTYDPSSGIYVPSYAQIVSFGVDGTGGSNNRASGRTITTTYVFKTSNRNIAGGQLRIYPTGNNPAMCIDAGSAQPTAGTQVALRPCSTSVPPAQQQVFSYTTDLTLQLISSATPSYVNGLCLDAAATSGSPAQAATGTAIVLNQCSGSPAPVFSQQWSFNDNGHFQSARSDSSTTGTLGTTCMAVANQNGGTQLKAQSCTGPLEDPGQAWIPSPSVGAGAAADPQLVNFQQFGRCLDITGQNVNADHLIAFPCKQNPQPTAVTWNQKFTYQSSTGWLTTSPSSSAYCLWSPRTETGLVLLKACTSSGSNAAGMKWTRLGTDAATAYSRRYTYTDASTDASTDAARCLAIGDPIGNDFWSSIRVATCNGSTAQKWNADPNTGLPSFQNTTEEK